MKFLAPIRVSNLWTRIRIDEKIWKYLPFELAIISSTCWKWKIFYQKRFPLCSSGDFSTKARDKVNKEEIRTTNRTHTTSRKLHLESLKSSQWYTKAWHSFRLRHENLLSSNRKDKIGNKRMDEVELIGHKSNAFEFEKLCKSSGM